MKLYKFRGKDIETGKFIYGDLIHSHSEKGGVLISEERPISTHARRVAPDSVAQFLGYDKNGKEIYSDDRVRVFYHYCKQQEVEVNTENFFIISDIGITFDNVELVEGK